MVGRKSYEDSCKVLQELTILDPGEFPTLPTQPPRLDDEDISGLRFFRTRLDRVSLIGLTLPRTFFGRSEIREVSFSGSDLSESTAAWNDFIDVDFRGCDLSRADLRASIFERVNFQDAILRGANLCRATFRDCTFTDADLTGAQLSRNPAWLLRLSRTQRDAVNWQWRGEEPQGG
jgi:uncharacterized protein YjbI with pentapeptide repeats